MSRVLDYVVKVSDMSEEMQQAVKHSQREAAAKCNTEKDIASYIKDEIKAKYPGTWHCVVGRNFGSHVTHELKHYIYFYIGQQAILLFKTG